VRKCRLGLVAAAVVTLVRPAIAQQRPLVTEDPEPIGTGRVLIEAGVDYGHNQEYPASGLKGNLWRLPIAGVSVGISSIAELQIDGGPFDSLDITDRHPTAPLYPLVTATGTRTHDVDDLVIGTKIRLLAEEPGRPAIGFRFATKLPNATIESGLGLGTTDFFASLLGAKTVESIRVVGNIGIGILADPTDGTRQNDVLTYGVSFARAVTQQAEVVGEINGRLSTRGGGPLPGTESRSIMRLGGRYTRGPIRFDAAVSVGLTSIDPTIGFTTGFTYVFNAFSIQ